MNVLSKKISEGELYVYVKLNEASNYSSKIILLLILFI